MEYSQEMSGFEAEQFEFGQTEWSGESSLFSEAEEMELANELLSVSNEAELDQFLGGFLKRAAKAVGGAIRSPVGQAIGGMLKGVAKKALPMAGTAIGGYFGGPLGAKIGGGLANAASSALGLEAEMMQQEDHEFEGARQFVRLASNTVSRAVSAPAGGDPKAAALAAVQAATRQFAPGLLAGRPAMPPSAPSGPTASARPGGAAQGRGQSGRWMRQGNKIILFGA
jgi:hypothetical protein